MNEGNVGFNDAVFTANLSKASGKTVSVQIATSDGTATAPDDYTANTKTLTFAPGETSKNFTVDVKGDYLAEPNETFTATLFNPVNTTIGTPGSATGFILNDDTGSALSIGDFTANEGAQGSTTTFKLKVTLAPSSTGTVTVDYATADGTATSGPDPFNLSGQSDYRAKSGTLTFTPGQTSKTISVTVNGDKLGEANETFFVNLSNPVHAVFTDTQGVGTIKNDESATACTILGTNANEVINGTSGDDIICASGGDDTVHGNGGNDTVKGGNGNDILYGDAGNDVIQGEAGNNTMYGGDDDDTLTGNIGKDQMYGENGDDVMHGSDGIDTLDGGAGSDQLFGEAGNDALNSADGVGGNDSIDGGTGTDTATSDPGDTVTRVP